MSEVYKLLWKASGFMDAQLIINYMESFGIEVVSYGGSVGQAYGLTSTPLGGIELHVKATQYEEAENILNSYFSSDPEDVN